MIQPQHPAEDAGHLANVPPTPLHVDTTGGSKRNPLVTPSSNTSPTSKPDEEAQNEADRQLFQSEVNKKMDVPNGYLNVGVLMLRWQKGLDEFPKHDQEIGDLKEVFEHQFHYECEIVELHNQKSPQHQLNHAIANHLLKYDGPNSLLIIYYTGHGFWREDKQDLEISASNKFELPKCGGKYNPTALWLHAEEQLLDETEGGPESDVLFLMDCCFASNLQKSSTSHQRTVELMAASSKDTKTPGPGEKSFTTALIAALRHLVEKDGKTGFPTSKLHQEILHRRSEPVAMLFDRFNRHLKRIKLTPLDKPNAEERQKIEDFFQEPEKSSVVIRFSLKEARLSNCQIEAFARELPAACEKSDIPVRKIEWLKMETMSRKMISMGGAVQVFRFAARHRLRRTREALDTTLAQTPPPMLSSLKRRPTSDLPNPPLAPNERQLIAAVVYSSSLGEVLGSIPGTPPSGSEQLDGMID